MIIGITGGVGVGKTTVLNVLQSSYKARVIIADNVAKSLMKPGNDCYDKVVEAFGPEILFDVPEDMLFGNSNKPIKPAIDRKKLSDIVFDDPEKLEKLNAAVHPEVKKAILKAIYDIYEVDDNALIVLEAALLIEDGYEELCDEMWVVTAKKEKRIERLMLDRKYTREKCESIMDDQLSEDEYLAHADFVLENTGNIEETVKQIKKHFISENIKF